MNMKTIHKKILSILVFFFLLSCNEETLLDEYGYLHLNINANEYVNIGTKVAEDYNPKQIAVEIRNASDEVVKSSDDWETLEKEIKLPPGEYTVKAFSKGFDGSESGYDIPYYAGSKKVTISAGHSVKADITCYLANVKVTVNFDQSFIDAFKSANVTVSSVIEDVNTLQFVMGETLKTAYFPVGNLNSTVSVVNKSGKTFSQKNEIVDVQARDHYILNYKVAQVGEVGGVSVSIDGTEMTYTFTFGVSTDAETSLAVNQANAWSSFAYLEGYIASTDQELLPENMSFEYKSSGENEWKTVSAEFADDKYSAKIINLVPSTNYTYKMVYKSGDISFMSEERSFITESDAALPNGNLDSWYKSGKTWYAVSESDYNDGNLFWDSSNPGTTTGAGALVNKNPTQGSNAIVHTPGGISAELKSQYASAFGIGKFAAASLYTGQFNSLVGTDGAKIDFGRQFTSRPISLHGFFHYTPVKIDYLGGNQPEGTVQKGNDDICSIYIALAKKTYTVDNTNTGTFIQFETDPNIIAYGELPLSECVNTNGQWKEFTIPLKYKNLDEKPTHIIIVASSSKYGDYFTGGNGSVMYLDDMSLVYEGEPTLWE